MKPELKTTLGDVIYLTDRATPTRYDALDAVSLPDISVKRANIAHGLSLDRWQRRQMMPCGRGIELPYIVDHASDPGSELVGVVGEAGCA
jgi:hypothetical protein